MKINISSNLLGKLQEKSGESTFSDGMFVVFEQFAGMVAEELKQINLLFDEYTPHDNTHMQSLLRITDELLGSEVIGNLNCIELCILACAIYGHDWGMAISLDEKERIVTGRIPNGKKEEDFALLEDELLRWRNYALSCGIAVGVEGYAENHNAISKNQWREYVRQTHADRARMRAIHYFQSKGDIEPLGIPVGEVCAGHWYDIAQIRRISTNWSVGGLVINLQALAVYTRFIDLLDIGNNRTPYALRKFVNPRDPKSKIEWKKHQAINPVTITAKPSTIAERTMHFHGATSNHIVYAALQDLKRYCAMQIEENVSILCKQQSYDIGKIDLDWNIQPQGFEPIDIRFEFDRDNMFNLLSSEIYEGDPYVFIRELIQNAIDTIMLRQGRYKKADLAIAAPLITVNAEHDVTGDVAITVIDCGTGMTFDIVRDYLATIGKSYYKSKEFDAVKSDMKSISRFGVGLISCFEVADSISIETETDPQFGVAERFKIEITDRAQQFRVQKETVSGKPGTKVVVNVKAVKWRKEGFSDHQNLKVTEYVKAIAGFVPFPILIVENEVKTIVCSADATDSIMLAVKSKFPNIAVHQEDLGFGFEDAFEPQDVELAPSILTSNTLPISSDANGVHINGGLAYFSPTDAILASTRKATGGRGASYFSVRDAGIMFEQLRWVDANHPRKSGGVAPSATKSLFSRVYFRGILVPELDINIPEAGGTPRARITVNLDCERDELIPKLSRLGLKTTADAIAQGIQDIFKIDIHEKYIHRFMQSDPVDRLILLGRLSRYICPTSMLADIFPIDEWPAVTLDRSGSLQIRRMKELPYEIEVAPNYFFQKQKEVNKSLFIKPYILERKISDAGTIVTDNKPMTLSGFGFEHDDGSPQEWKAMDSCLSSALESRYKLSYIRIGDSGDPNLPYVIQSKVFNTEQSKSKDRCVSYMQFHPFNLTFAEFDPQISKILCVLVLEYGHISTGDMMHKMIFNSQNAVGKIFKSAIDSANEKNSSLSLIELGKIKDVFHKNPFIGHCFQSRVSGIENLIAQWAPEFCFAVAEAGLILLKEEDRQILREAQHVVVCRE